MRYLRGPIVALVAFTFGVAISPIHFFVESIACGLGSSTTTYRSSYLIQVSSSHLNCRSTEKANEVFNDKLHEALRVIEVTPKLNSHGVPVGQRAVALFFLPELNEYRARVFWTDGATFHSISSTSFLHVRQFEKTVGRIRLG